MLSFFPRSGPTVKPSSTIRAVVFDLDGLMFDTEALFFRVASDMLAARGKVFTAEIMRAMIGRRSVEAGEAFRTMAGLDEPLEDLMTEVRARFFAEVDIAVHPTPGLIALLAHLGARSIPLAVATSSHRAYAERLLSEHGLADRFDFVLASEDVTLGKPDPEIYRKAVERFGLPADSVLVLEDSPAGLAAAKGAGAFAVGVPHDHSPAEGLHAADLIVPRLDDPALLALLDGESRMTESTTSAPSVVPYVAPMVGFLALTAAEGYLPTRGGGVDPFWYPVVYALKVAIVAVLAWMSRSAWRDLQPRPGPGALALATALGLGVAALWVGLDGLYPELPFAGGKRSSFDPNAMPRAGMIAFVAVRLLGLVILVPLIEELFWRSFLMRWVIDPDFARVPIGKVTPLAAAVTSVAFGLAHPEWLPGLITGLAWAWLVWRTKSISACVVSHAVANLALGLYVIATGDWKYW